MVAKKSLGVLFVFMLFLLSIGSVYSVKGLNVVLSSQNPDPVEPGNFVFVNVKVANSGDEDIESAVIRLIENGNFIIAQGNPLVEDLGVISAFSTSEGSTSFVIAKYKVFVRENTPLGENTIEFEVDADGRLYEYEFDILVEDDNPRLQITNFNIDSIEPGESGQLLMEIENINSVDLRDIVVSLDLDEVEDEVLSIEAGTNEKTISSIKAGERQSISFDLVAIPDADSKPYLLPVVIDYEDSLGTNYTTELLGSVRVFSTPQVSLTLDSQDVYTQGKGKITLAVANFGTSTVKGTQVEILPSEDYEIISGENQYVGDLNPDDFQTVQAQLFVKNSEAVTLRVKMDYLDSYNVKNTQTIEIPMKIYSARELNQFGLQAGSGNGGGFVWIIVVLIVIAAAFYFGRRHGIKKGKKQS